MSLNSSWNSSKLPNCKVSERSATNSNHQSNLVIVYMTNPVITSNIPLESLTFPASRKCISMKSSSRLFYKERKKETSSRQHSLVSGK